MIDKPHLRSGAANVSVFRRGECQFLGHEDQDRDALAGLGGNPQASYHVNLRPGFISASSGVRMRPSWPPPRSRVCKAIPGPANLQSTFMLMGKGVTKGKQFGQIDMRSIAPTLASVMNVPLPDAEAQPVSWRR